MKTSIKLAMTIAVLALLWGQAAISQADQASSAQITFYVA
jgi:hypothetical protein